MYLLLIYSHYNILGENVHQREVLFFFFNYIYFNFEDRNVKKID